MLYRQGIFRWSKKRAAVINSLLNFSSTLKLSFFLSLTLFFSLSFSLYCYYLYMNCYSLSIRYSVCCSFFVSLTLYLPSFFFHDTDQSRSLRYVVDMHVAESCGHSTGHWQNPSKFRAEDVFLFRLGTSSIPTRNKVLFTSLYRSCLAGNELVPMTIILLSLNCAVFG